MGSDGRGGGGGGGGGGGVIDEEEEEVEVDVVIYIRCQMVHSEETQSLIMIIWLLRDWSDT